MTRFWFLSIFCAAGGSFPGLWLKRQLSALAKLPSCATQGSARHLARGAHPLAERSVPSAPVGAQNTMHMAVFLSSFFFCYFSSVTLRPGRLGNTPSRSCLPAGRSAGTGRPGAPGLQDFPAPQPRPEAPSLRMRTLPVSPSSRCPARASARDGPEADAWQGQTWERRLSWRMRPALSELRKCPVCPNPPWRRTGEPFLDPAHRTAWSLLLRLGCFVGYTEGSGRVACRRGLQWSSVPCPRAPSRALESHAGSPPTFES